MTAFNRFQRSSRPGVSGAERLASISALLPSKEEDIHNFSVFRLTSYSIKALFTFRSTLVQLNPDSRECPLICADYTLSVYYYVNVSSRTSDQQYKEHTTNSREQEESFFSKPHLWTLSSLRYSTLYHLFGWERLHF